MAVPPTSNAPTRAQPALASASDHMDNAARWSKAQLLLGRRRLSTHHAPSRSLLSRTLSGDSPYSAAYQYVTGLLLVGSIVLVVADSVEPWASRNVQLLTTADGLISTATALDYAARLATCTERAVYGDLGPVRGRLLWMRSWEAMVDAAASLPFFVDVLLPIVEIPPLTWLRVFRIARIFRTSHYVAAVRTAGRVLFVNREILYVALTLVSFMIFVTSAMLFFAGGDECGAKNGLDSLPGAMYAAVLMLTGLGSPEGELNVALRLVTVLTAFLSVPFFAVPAAMLTWGFEGEAARLAAHERRRFHRKQVYGGSADGDSSDDDEEDGDDDAELAEYLDGVGGGEEAEAEGAEEAALAFFVDETADDVSLLHTAQRLANRLGSRRLEAARARQLQLDALKLVHKVGAASAAGLTAESERRLELKLRQFRRVAKRVLASGCSRLGDTIAEGSVSQHGKATTKDAVADAAAASPLQPANAAAVNALREDVSQLRRDMSRVLDAVEKLSRS